MISNLFFSCVKPLIDKGKRLSNAEFIPVNCDKNYSIKEMNSNSLNNLLLTKLIIT